MDIQIFCSVHIFDGLCNLCSIVMHCYVVGELGMGMVGWGWGERGVRMGGEWRGEESVKGIALEELGVNGRGGRGMGV